jgi:predicted TIM-barrel fold metal-dependent hydrolase
MPHHRFDAHFHIIDPAFPLLPNHGFLPEPFTVADYRRSTESLGITAGAVVSGSFQGFGQRHLLSALQQLGPGFVGVIQLSAQASDAEILALNARGVRAVRFNLRRGGSESVQHLEALALRLHALVGWPVELYVESRELAALQPLLRRLPAVSIDHLGLTRDGFATLLQLAEQGVRVKASGFSRVELPVAEALRALHAANPQALMFGTDLPSTRAPRPFHPSDLTLLIETLGEPAAQRALWSNAASFYRLPAPLV